MNCQQIIEKYLTDNGYDGLCHADPPCGCLMGDEYPFLACGEAFDECVPGYRQECDGPGTEQYLKMSPEDREDVDEFGFCDGDCKYHVGAEKPGKGAT